MNLSHKSVRSIEESNRNEGERNTSRFPMNLPTLFPEESQLTEKQWKGPFSFVHACDPQLGLIEKYILKREDPKWNVDVAHLKCAIKMINQIQPKPRFLVIGGDMVDTPPYEETFDTHVGQFEDFKACFAALDPEIKLIFVCGNHDVGDVPTFSTMDVYRAEFGPEYFSFWEGGVKFTVLNSQYFKFPEALQMESFQQLDFLENLRNENAVHHVIFQHIPLCIEAEDEIDISFLNVEKPVRKQVLDAVSNAGAKQIFYGHTHRNGISKVRNIEQVLTAAVGGTFDDTKSGFRVVYVTENEITHEYIPLEIQFKEMGLKNNSTVEDIMTLLRKIEKLKVKNE